MALFRVVITLSLHTPMLLSFSLPPRSQDNLPTRAPTNCLLPLAPHSLSCPACQAGFDAGCSSAKISGYYTPGTFQQYTLAPAQYVTPIPDGLPSDTAAPMLCGGVTVYSALKKSRAQPGDFVVVTGAGGGLGHLALQIGGRGMGFRMLAVDAGEKEALCRECGAEAFFDITKYPKGEEGTKQLAEAIKKETAGGLGAAAVIVCTAANAAYAQALEFLRFNGTVVCVGIPEGDATPIANASPSLFIIKQLNVVGSAVGSRKEAIETLEMARRGVVKTHFRTETMDRLGTVFHEMEKGTLQGRVVLDLQA